MLRELKLKPDFGRTIDRFEAWWNGAVIDRPPISMQVRSATAPAAHNRIPVHRSADVEYTIDQAAKRLEQQVFLGDSFPALVPDPGPEIFAASLGRGIYAMETAGRICSAPGQEPWRMPLDLPADCEDECWRDVERMTDYALETAGGRFVVGVANLHGSFDVLSRLRGPQTLCLDLLDDPDLVGTAARTAASAFVEAFTRLYLRITRRGMGCTTWAPFYHEGPACLLSCDFWCLVSDRLARETILPVIEMESRPLKRSLFHLDGPQALRHLELVLSIPKVRAVQWAFGTGHGRATQWIDVYRRIRDAQRSAHVLATDPDDALDVLEALGPAGLWIQVEREFDCPQSASDFLNEVGRLSCRRR